MCSSFLQWRCRTVHRKHAHFRGRGAAAEVLERPRDRFGDRAPKWEASAGMSKPKNRFIVQLRRATTCLESCESGYSESRIRSEPPTRFSARGERRDATTTEPRRTMSVRRRENSLANQQTQEQQKTHVCDLFPHGYIQSEELPAGSAKIMNQQIS